MNARNIRFILKRWSQNRQNTAVIGRALKLKECDVDSVVARFMNERYLEREKPFSKVKA
jgi:hypothetical protein